MNTRLKFSIYQYYLAFIILTAVGSVVFVVLFWPHINNPGIILLTIFGSLASLIFIIQKQQLEEMNSFKELFNEFNRRYNELNESLNSIVRTNPDQSLSTKQIDILYDYFNLCGEEYLFYQKGYIYPEVWRAWCNGIYYYLSHPSIGKTWKQEEETDSYYGLTLERIKRFATYKPSSKAY